MKATGIALLALVVAELPVPALAEGEPSVVEMLIGAWRLVSLETVLPSGEVTTEWMGKEPSGLIIYDRSGRVSAQIMRDPRPTFANKQSPTALEFEAAYKGFYSYFGTYEFNPKTNVVTHHVRASLRPEEVGIDYKRNVKLQGDQLILTTHKFKSEKGDMVFNRLVWERAK